MNELMNQLKKMYIDFINALDPYWDAYEESKNVTGIEPPEMLYNLIEIKKDWDLSDDIELSKRLDALIYLFKQNNVEPSIHNDELKSATSAPLFTNDEILLLSNGLIDSMSRYDKAASDCALIPEAYETIKAYRKSLEELNNKVLSLYDSTR